MNGYEFKAARKALGLTKEEMGKQLGTPDNHYAARAITSWEYHERKIPPAVEKLINIMLKAKG